MYLWRRGRKFKWEVNPEQERARSSRWQGSVAAGVREINGADKRDRHEEQNSGDQSIEDHVNLLRFHTLDCKPTAKGTSRVFNELKSTRCAEKSPKADICRWLFAPIEYWN